MAIFAGTIQEFSKFIGAYARIKVMYIAARHKKQIGKCEHCGSLGNLEAAHINGKERPLIISNILGEHFDGTQVKIDLNEFEDKFVAAHLPIENTIKILCKSCHREYDRKRKIHELGDETDQNAGKGSSPIQNQEAGIIETLIFNTMNKNKALQIAYSHLKLPLNNGNTIFSNIVGSSPMWWLQPQNDKFQSDLFIILNHDSVNKLYFFKLPAGTIQKPGVYFKQRNDRYRRDCSDIYIPISGIKFVEKNGFDFTKYLLDRVKY